MTSPSRRAPSCSVVIPTHNCLSYLELAIASVRLQVGVDYEIVVVDDGSSDGTWDWLSAQALEDRRIVPLRLDGRGPAVARNHALAHAKAPLIAFLDADDFWWPGKLARQLAAHHADPEISFTFTDYLHADPEGGVHGTSFNFWKPRYVDRRTPAFRRVPDAELALLESNVVGTSTVVASTRALQIANGFAECGSAEDWRLWLRLARDAPVVCSASVTMSYMMRPGSETRNRAARIQAMSDLIDEYAERPDARRAVRRARARVSVARAELARDERRFWDAGKFHLQALAGRPDLRTARSVVSDLLHGLRGVGAAAAVAR